MSSAKNHRLLRNLLIVLLVVVTISRASAASIDYLFTGNITGTFGPTTLTNANFAWHVNGTTSGITNTQPLRYLNTGASSTITITGSSGAIIAVATVTDSVNVAVDGNLPGVTMTNTAGTFGLQLLTGGSPGSSIGYFLDADVGPINAGVNAGAGSIFASTASLNTSSGPLKITAVANLTFQGFLNFNGQIISQVADGGGWHTGFVGNNTTTGPLSVNVACFQDAGNGVTTPWQPPLASNSFPLNLVLPPGGIVFLNTTGTASSTTTGWCQANGDPGFSLYAIFTQSVAGRPDQDVTSPATPSNSNVLIPFDNTSGLVTTIAVVNPGSAAITVNPYIRVNPSGTVSAGTPFVLPPGGHIAVSVPGQFAATAGAQGLLDLYTATGQIAALALRFNPTGGIAGGQATAQKGLDIFGQ
jgi:hypothetical protein